MGRPRGTDEAGLVMRLLRVPPVATLSNEEQQLRRDRGIRNQDVHPANMNGVGTDDPGRQPRCLALGLEGTTSERGPRRAHLWR